MILFYKIYGLFRKSLMRKIGFAERPTLLLILESTTAWHGQHYHNHAHCIRDREILPNKGIGTQYSIVSFWLWDK